MDRPFTGQASPDELMSIARRAAFATASRREARPGPWPVRLLHHGPTVDVWLRHWAAAPFDELHGHDGSASALTVVRGEIVEWHWDADEPTPSDLAAMTAEEATVGGPGPRRRVLASGRTVHLPPGHVHDLGCRDAAGAVTVQAYSPPLRRLSYYGMVAGRLFLRRTELHEALPRAV